MPVQISATEKQLTVRAELPGFKAYEIKVSVEPNRLIISGESQSEVEQQTEQTIYNERRSRQFFRAIAMPADVGPKSAAATLKDGVLEVTLDKVESVPAVKVEVKTTQSSTPK